MPRRSIWKGSFVDAFLFRIKKNIESLMSRKIWSRRSSISPEFVDCSVLIYNGKTPICCKITKGKVGHKINSESLLLHGDEDPIEQIEERAERGKSKV